MLIDWNTIPGYREAVEHENSIRDAAFLGVNELIAGIEVVPLTAERFLILDGIKSPFVCNGVPTAVDVALFLWVCSPEFSISDKKARGQFMRRARSVNYTEACYGGTKYIEDTFTDAPGGGATGKQSYASWMASIVDILASEYHWAEKDILTIPLKRLFQYLRMITLRHNPKAILFNKSERIRSAWLAEQNRKAAAN